MKPTKLFLALIAAFTTVCGFAQDVESSNVDYYEIKGELKNVPDSTIIELSRVEDNLICTIMTDTIVDGRFHFRIKPGSLSKERLSLGCYHSEQFPKMSLRLWASAGDNVKVTGENTLIYTWRVEGNAPENAAWQTFLNDSRELYDNLQRNLLYEYEIYKEAMLLPQEKRQAYRKAKNDSIRNVANAISIQIHANEIRRMKEAEVDAVWLDRLFMLARSCKLAKDYPYTKEVIALYNSLTEEQRKEKLAQEARAMLFPLQHVEVGKEMADTELFDLKGNKHHLAELKGKYILIDFWSSGCTPCIMAIPEMEELATAYKDKLNIVSISTDNKNAWEIASEKHRMSWNNWNDLKGQSGIYVQYDQRSIPNYTLVSPEGIVLEQWTGYNKGDLKQKLDEYIKE